MSCTGPRTLISTIFIYLLLTSGNKMSSIWHRGHVIYCLVSLNLYKPSMLTPMNTFWLWFSLVKWVCCETELWAPAWYRRPPVSVSRAGVLSNSSPMRRPGLSPRSMAIFRLEGSRALHVTVLSLQSFCTTHNQQLHSVQYLCCILPCIMPQVVTSSHVTWTLWAGLMGWLTN